MATLTYKVNATVTVGGKEHRIDFSQTKTVTQLIDTVIKADTTDRTIFNVDSAETGATLADFTFGYIENLDATNFITVGVKQTGSADVYYQKVLAGDCFMIHSKDFSAAAGGEASGVGSPVKTITVLANSAPCLVRAMFGDDA